MNQYDSDFLDYLAETNTKVTGASEKEIDKTCSVVIKKCGLKKKTSGTKKCGRVLLIAAAVAACATITAAAYGINIGDICKGYFENSTQDVHSSQKITDVNGNTSKPNLKDNQLKVLSKSGELINQSVTDNGTTVTLKAVACNKSSAYIMFDVTAPEGTKLSRDDYVFEKVGEIFDLNDVPSYSMDYKISTIKDENPNDNKKSFILRESCNGFDMRGRKMSLKLTNLSTVREEKAENYYTHVVEGTWEFKPVTLTSNIKSKEITVNKITNFDDSKRSESKTNCAVKSVSISPFSTIAYFHGKAVKTKGDSFQTPFGLTVHFKDGTKLFVDFPDSGETTGTESNSAWLFDTPVDVNDVESITLGDLDIPVS